MENRFKIVGQNRYTIETRKTKRSAWREVEGFVNVTLDEIKVRYLFSGTMAPIDKWEFG